MSHDLEMVCRDERRKVVILDHPSLNGIDYVEYDEFPALLPEQRYRLAITFLKAPATLTSADISITGGVRITGIRPLSSSSSPSPPLEAAPAPPNPPFTLFVQLDGSGDFSDYVVRVNHTSLDRQLDHAVFSFKAGCPTDLDCRPVETCEETPPDEPLLDYLAKDFSSFRRLMLDLARTRNPRWQESSVAELGTTLVELLAYKGDQLSWSQDAVATEAFLETCRLRVSAKRHSRFIDHRMHDGRNAWGFAVLDASASGVVPIGTRFLTRIVRPLRGDAAPPGPVIPHKPDSAFDEDPALRAPLVFEATARTPIDPALNRLFVHAMGDGECCLPRGTTQAFLFGVDVGLAAYRPALAVGDWLLLEEVKGVETGATADANPAHRRCVRLVEVRKTLPTPGGPVPLTDPAFAANLLGTAEEPVLDPIGAGEAVLPRLPLVEVIWREDQALDISLCLSATTPRGDVIGNILTVRGNVVPVDHGRTVTVALDDIPEDLPGFSRASTLRLPAGPLTFEAPASGGPRDANARPIAGRHDLGVDVRTTLPAVTVALTLPGAPPALWRAVPDLLDSGPFEEHFCAEVDDAGLAMLRFGDGEHGRSAQGATAVAAMFRVGNGAVGNVGRDAIAHMLVPDPSSFIDPANPAAPPSVPPALNNIRQPIAAIGGVDPETIDEVRALAAAAMRSVQFRAVTEADWQARAMTIPGVADAKATFRWTGSWHTVFVALHPADADHLVTQPGGRTSLADRFAARASLTRVRIAGYDMELDTAAYVPLFLKIRICVATGHFRGAVLQAVGDALSNRRFADGRIGFFHPSRMRFGEPVRLSRIIATAQVIEGVSSLEVLGLRRYWMLPNGELESGVLELGPFEIARLDNDPSLPENGVLELDAVGGL